MPKLIRVAIPEKQLSWLIELNETETAERVYEALPKESSVEVWGEEIYFPIGVTKGEGDITHEFVAPGDVGYWETEQCVCLFFGPTPESPPGTIKPDDPVVIIGRIISPFGSFKDVTDGDKVIATKEI
ncbi:MAG: cyclophilin-like fold protein [Armatimonadota bacterium]|nr:cyclophilin-like fold protein [Armatimonadota bacterium]MCX7777322.1 cyclophilin-like fold protein [Armatimonadota bacterium]MDW8024361.1 cyclophilin-like fold protein [Armatimonadota bacterium]